MSKIIGQFNLPTPTPVAAQIFNIDKTDNKSDSELLATIIGANAGDVAIITVKDEDGVTVLSQSPYMYDGQDWFALTGTLDASKVILQNDITLAGAYSQVGNITKTQNGTGTLSVKGKTVEEAFMEIFTKRLQPSTPTQPAVSGFSLTGAGTVEAGTKVATATFGTAALSAGSYVYGPATGITATSWSVDRVCVPTSFNAAGVATATSGTDTNGGNGFIIGDQGGENVVSSLKYTATATYGDGAVAYDNLGSPSNPEVKIAAGSKSQTTAAYTPFRKYFYGALTSADAAIDSAFIRGLTNSTGAASNGKAFSITVPEGARRVVIAYPATYRDLTSVKDVNAFGTDIVGSFAKSVVAVEGANGYTAIDYKVYVYEPAAALGANTFNVTI